MESKLLEKWAKWGVEMHLSIWKKTTSIKDNNQNY